MAQIRELQERETGVRRVQAAAAVLTCEPIGGAERDCATCTDPIEAERLAAAPGAIRCTFCQEAFERHRRLFPGRAR